MFGAASRTLDGEDRSERIGHEGKAQHTRDTVVCLCTKVSYPTAKPEKNLRNQPENNMARGGGISRSVTPNEESTVGGLLTLFLSRGHVNLVARVRYLLLILY